MSSDTIRVAVIDDHEVVCQGFEQMINHEPDMEIVGSARDINNSLLLIKQSIPDIVLVDVRLQNESGFDLIEKARAMGTKAIFIMITGFESEHYLSQALEIGALGLITKGSPKGLILNAIRVAYNGGSVWSRDLLFNTYRSASCIEYPHNKPSIQRTNLTIRENEIVRLLIEGNTNKTIAHRLGLSDTTIKKNMKNIMNKLHVDNRVKLALLVSKLDLNI